MLRTSSSVAALVLLAAAPGWADTAESPQPTILSAGYAASPAVTAPPIPLPPPPAAIAPPACPLPYPATPAAVPADSPPVLLPPPATVVAPVIRYRPLIPVARNTRPVYYGEGWLGQPKVYVPGQPVRNFLRYLSP